MSSAAVRLSGIGLTYPGPPPVTALSEVDLAIGVGEYVAIVGPSGSGKSTLLNILGLLDRPTAGIYELNGTDVSKLNDTARSANRGQRIGFVFQSFHLLDYRSAVENVMLGAMYQPKRASRTASRDRAVEVLESVGMGHRLWAPPSQLSGGERQRVAIARALVNRPALLLCDEPTGNLDTSNTTKVLDMLSELNRDAQQTLIVITHDLAVAASARRRLSITDGRLTDVI